MSPYSPIVEKLRSIFSNIDTRNGERGAWVSEVLLHDLVDALQELNHERSHAKQALEEQTNWFELSRSQVPLGTWDLNVPQKTLRLSRELWESLGLAASFEAQPTPLEPWIKIIPKVDQATLMEAVQTHLEENTPLCDCEFRGQHRDGHFLWFHARGRVVSRDLSGLPIRLSGVCEEITARKEAELALEERNIVLDARIEEQTSELKRSELRHQLLFSLSPVGLVLCRLDGSFTELNGAFSQIIGTPLREAREGNWLEMQPSIYQKQSREVIDLLLQGKEVPPYELALFHQEGYLVPILVSTVLVEMKGQPFLWSSVEDLTSRKEIEAELMNAKEQADAASRAKSLFLANMSHEIRTPMNAILGFTQLLLDESALELRTQGYLVSIKQNCEHLLSLLSHVLDMSKSEAGQHTLEKESLSLRELCGEVQEMFRPAIEQKGILLHLRVSSAVPALVLADRAKLRQILTNLVGNAIKFTDVGEVTLSVDAEETDSYEDGKQIHHISIQIQDTGTGISPGELARIFNPFEQAEGRGPVTGTGLGLSICKAFVLLMGGEIQVESEVSQGSTFSLFLPLQGSQEGGFLEQHTANKVIEARVAPLSLQEAELLMKRAPCDWVSELLSHVQQGRQQQIQDVISRFHEISPRLERTLNSMSYSFQYDKLLYLCYLCVESSSDEHTTEHV